MAGCPLRCSCSPHSEQRTLGAWEGTPATFLEPKYTGVSPRPTSWDTQTVLLRTRCCNSPDWKYKPLWVRNTRSQSAIRSLTPAGSSWNPPKAGRGHEQISGRRVPCSRGRAAGNAGSGLPTRLPGGSHQHLCLHPGRVLLARWCRWKGTQEGLGGGRPVAGKCGCHPHAHGGTSECPEGSPAAGHAERRASMSRAPRSLPRGSWFGLGVSGVPEHRADPDVGAGPSLWTAQVT